MNNLLREQIREVDAAIGEKKRQIELALASERKLQNKIKRTQNHISELQDEIEQHEECRRIMLAPREFCDSLLMQVKTALIILQKADVSVPELIAFEKVVRSQLEVDPSFLFTEGIFIKIALELAAPVAPNSPIFTGIPTAPIARPIEQEHLDNVFTDIVEIRRFKIVCSQLARAQIYISQCYLDNPKEKWWVVNWKKEVAKLIWHYNEGWNIRPLNEDADIDELTGIWKNFNLTEYLEKNGVNAKAWYSDLPIPAKSPIMPIGNSAELAPGEPYGRGKVWGELWPGTSK